MPRLSLEEVARRLRREATIRGSLRPWWQAEPDEDEATRRAMQAIVRGHAPRGILWWSRRRRRAAPRIDQWLVWYARLPHVLAREA